MTIYFYTTGNDGQQHVFDNRNDADDFTRSEYKKIHPDAPDESHIDNSWDVAKRGFTDTVKNPVGQTVSQIAKWSGADPQTQKQLYDAGDNLLGKAARAFAAQIGAPKYVQDEFEKAGRYAENAIPVWGQAKYYGKVIGDAVEGTPPSPEDTANPVQDARSITGTESPSGSSTGKKTAQDNATRQNATKPSFNPPQRLEDGRIGYPLSPTQPPKLPASDKNPTQSSADNATLEHPAETSDARSSGKRPADAGPDEAPSTKRPASSPAEVENSAHPQRPADSTTDQPVTSGTNPTDKQWQWEWDSSSPLSPTQLDQLGQWDSSDLLSILDGLEKPGIPEGTAVSAGSPRQGPSGVPQNSPESYPATYLDLDSGAVYVTKGVGQQAGQTGVNPSTSSITAGKPSDIKPDTHSAPERTSQADNPESNPTWTGGDVRDLKIDARHGNADCGQFAAGNATGGYRVGSLDPVGTNHQVPDVRSPMGFNPAHGFSANDMIAAPVPIMAEGVAYVDLNTGAFHYGKLVGQSIMQTDANQYGRYGVGGTLSHYKMNNGRLEFIGQRGIQPVRHLSSIKDFVQYCRTHYDMSNALFFFCRFHKDGA
ncbi:hypothetical protein [Paraburkholderia dinghuensis]|uniref:Uncharacterized protein n=1 Tax=Paraburkholderia dinghuensis TaxID=2305225 RepID=A0A3N6NC72_9BURK|nr:hypothetical protein [Paraburkholderia dinghuensis]RQH08881.1 hypothetical protein D1Y85_03090 [Paraburkholderia dinghuensis]